MSQDQAADRPVDEWVPKVAESIREWRRDASKLRGVKPLSYAYIQEADAELLARITVSTVRFALTPRQRRAADIAASIAWRVESTLCFQRWRASKPGLEEDDLSPTDRLLIELTSGTYAEGWVPWDPDVRFRVGLTLLLCVDPTFAADFREGRR